MTMGPAPMIRMLLMSVRRGMDQLSGAADARRSRSWCLQAADHGLREAVEQRQQVVRTGAGFGVALEAERRACR